MIRELRILPPLAIARLGAAPTPMDNYDVVVDPERPLGPRTLRPAETLEVDEATGVIARTFVPDALRFTENGAARPVAPFLEVWALTDTDTLEPLTTTLLAAEGADPADVAWRAQVANHKVARRTGIDADRVSADTGEFSDHDPRLLTGGCPNFWPGRSILFGHVRYVRPDDARPEIRLRLTPAPGRVYGSSATDPAMGGPVDPNVVAVVYDASRGTWLGYQDPSAWTITVPGGIFAQDAGRRSRGYLDDSCDGLVRVSVAVGGRTLTAYSRVASGPPTYAPDVVPIRTVADELEQALFGPTVAPGTATVEQVEEIVRRAFETVRLMNTDVMNRGGMAGHDANENGRRPDPIMARSLVDTVALENLHQSLLAALRGGGAPWFADVLRPFDEVGDLTDRGRRRMPALMRGADGQHLALTRRQVDLIRALVRGPVFPDPQEEQP